LNILLCIRNIALVAQNLFLYFHILYAHFCLFSKENVDLYYFLILRFENQQYINRKFFIALCRSSISIILRCTLRVIALDWEFDHMLHFTTCTHVHKDLSLDHLCLFDQRKLLVTNNAYSTILMMFEKWINFTLILFLYVKDLNFM